MTVSRDFGAPRNASFWGIDAVTIICDGSPWPAPPCDANRVPLRAPAAANVRAHARAQGWRVNMGESHSVVSLPAGSSSS